MSKAISNHAPLLSARWFQPLVRRGAFSLPRFIDRHQDFNRDARISVSACFLDKWPNSSETCWCGQGVTAALPSGNVVVGLGSGGIGEYITPVQVVALCVAWKHEMEHVRQYTDIAVHDDAFDERIDFELMSVHRNPHFYQDNYGRFCFELEAHAAGYRDGFSMAKAALKEYGFSCSDEELVCCVLALAEETRDFRVGIDSPFDENECFLSIDNAISSLVRRSQLMRNGSPDDGSFFYMDGIRSNKGNYFCCDNTVDAVGLYAYGRHRSDEFTSVISSDDTSSLDVLRCVAAVNVWASPEIRRIVSTVRKSDFRLVSVDDFDAYADVRDHNSMGVLSAFPELNRFVGSINRSSAHKLIMTDELSL